MLQVLCCRGYAAGAMPQGLCCRGYAAGAVLPGLCCEGSAARALLQGLCCRGRAALKVVGAQRGSVLNLYESKPKFTNLSLNMGIEA